MVLVFHNNTIYYLNFIEKRKKQVLYLTYPSVPLPGPGGLGGF